MLSSLHPQARGSDHTPHSCWWTKVAENATNKSDQLTKQTNAKGLIGFIRFKFSPTGMLSTDFWFCSHCDGLLQDEMTEKPFSNPLLPFEFADLRTKSSRNVVRLCPLHNRRASDGFQLFYSSLEMEGTNNSRNKEAVLLPRNTEHLWRGWMLLIIKRLHILSNQSRKVTKWLL